MHQHRKLASKQDVIAAWHSNWRKFCGDLTKPGTYIIQDCMVSYRGNIHERYKRYLQEFPIESQPTYPMPSHKIVHTHTDTKNVDDPGKGSSAYPPPTADLATYMRCNHTIYHSPTRLTFCPPVIRKMDRHDCTVGFCKPYKQNK